MGTENGSLEIKICSKVKMGNDNFFIELGLDEVCSRNGVYDLHKYAFAVMFWIVCV